MRLFSALSITIAAAIAAPATAAEADSVSITVPTHDLNLTSEAGRNMLDDRITRAARQLCDTGTRSLRALTREAACMDDIREQAEAQIAGDMTIALTAHRQRA